MNWSQPLFLVPVLVGVVFILTGFIVLRFPPKKINSLYGYRTSSSMKSKNRWNFAQQYSSGLMIRIGVLVLLFCVPSFFVTFDPLVEMSITVGWIVLVTIYLFYRTEKKLKSKFD